MNFFLCDDDEQVLNYYHTKLKRLCERYQIDFHCTLYTSGMRMLEDFKRQNAYEGVLFLDVSMPEIDGVALAKQLRRNGCLGEIIFLTVSKRHFLDAFDVQAFHYVIKNETTDERFQEIFLQAVQAVRESSEEYLIFSSNGEHRSIPVRKIAYFEVVKHLVTVHYERDQFEFFSTLGKLENQLFSKGFIRIHRSFMAYIPQIHNLTYTELTLRDGTKLPVGRKFYNGIREALVRYSNTDPDAPATDES